MALLWSDSFDYYDTANMLQAYDAQTTGNSISSVAARNGTNGLISATSGGKYVQKNIPSTTDLYHTFAVNVLGAPNGLTSIQSFNTPGSVAVFALAYDINGRLSALTGNPGSGSVFTVTIATSSLVLKFGTYHYIEIFVSTGLGVIQVKLDGTFIFNISNVLSGTNTFAPIGQVRLGEGAGFNVSPASHYYDDHLIFDTTGNQFNAFIGDAIVNGQMPTGNGTEDDFQRGGTTINPQNWQQVNEIPQDGDGTYVYGATVGSMDRYTFPALSASSGLVFGTVSKAYIEKDTAGTRNFRYVLLSQGNLIDNGSDIPLTQGYASTFAAFPVDPATGVAWSIPGVNAAEQGVKITL